MTGSVAGALFALAVPAPDGCPAFDSDSAQWSSQQSVQRAFPSETNKRRGLRSQFRQIVNSISSTLATPSAELGSPFPYWSGARRPFGPALFRVPTWQGNSEFLLTEAAHTYRAPQGLSQEALTE